MDDCFGDPDSVLGILYYLVSLIQLFYIWLLKLVKVLAGIFAPVISEVGSGNHIMLQVLCLPVHQLIGSFGVNVLILLAVIQYLVSKKIVYIADI